MGLLSPQQSFLSRGITVRGHRWTRPMLPHRGDTLNESVRFICTQVESRHAGALRNDASAISIHFEIGPPMPSGSHSIRMMCLWWAIFHDHMGAIAVPVTFNQFINAVWRRNGMASSVPHIANGIFKLRQS